MTHIPRKLRRPATNRRKLARALSRCVLAGSAALLVPKEAAQAAMIWDGGGTTDLWSDTLNWDDDLFPGYGTLTFAGNLRTTNIVDANISQNQLLWTGTSAWTLNNAGGAVISLFDNGGVQAKLENQSTGLVTINAPITFAATAGAAWGEINAVNGGMTFGSGGTLTVNGSAVAGIRMFGAGQTTTFNNTVDATGKYFATTAATAGTVEIGGAFTSGDFYLMNGSTLKLNTGGSLTTSGLRLGGDFGTTGAQDLALGAIFQFTDVAGGQSFGSTINTVTGNTSNALLIDSLNTAGTNTLSGGVFLDSPLRIQVAAGGTVAATGVVSNGSSLTKQGDGTLTLSNTNTYGGGTILSAGTLNMGVAGALGSGALTVSGNSTLDNTSGGAITLSTNNAQAWNGSFAFTGTNALNLGTGAVAVGGTLGDQTITVTNNGAALTAGGAVSGGTSGTKTLVVAGAGSTTLSGNFSLGAATGFVLTTTSGGTLTLGGTNSITTLNINGGAASIVDIGAGTLTASNGGGAVIQSTTGGTINGTGTISVSSGGDFGTAGGTTLTVNPALTGAVGFDFWNNNGGAGLGTIVLAGANTYTGATNVQNTKVVIPAGAAINALNTANIGQIRVSDAGTTAVLSVEGGTINATSNAAPALSIGSFFGAASGVINQSAGTVTSSNSLDIGRGSASYAAYALSGGTLNTGSWFVVGFNNDRAIVNQSGGTINIATNRMTIGAGGAGSIGVVNQTAGDLNVAAGGNTGIFVGENGNGTYNISGGNLTLNTNGGATSGTLQFAGNAASTVGNFNLNGGTVTAFGVTKGASNAAGVYRFNFNGGTLKANGTNANFFADLALTDAYVNAGGAVIDTNGFNVTVAEPLLAPTGDGVSSVAVTAGGVGYIGTPLVQITGDGTGATAVATINASGEVTGIAITNPGIGYTTATATLLGGGGAGATLDVPVLAANTSGGLTKTGAGTLTLTGANTFTGTTVNAGTLTLTRANNDGTGVIRGALTINAGATVRLTDPNVLGYNHGAKVTTIDIVGGLLDTTANGEQGFGHTFNLTGGTMQSNGGVSSAVTPQFYVMANGTTVNTFASATTSTIAGRINLRENNPGGILTFTVADGAAATDLLLSAAVTTGSAGAGMAKSGAGTMTMSGVSNYSGVMNVNAGTLNVPGTLTTTGQVSVGSAAASLATMNVPTGGSITANNFAVGTNATATGAVFQDGGNVTLTQAAGAANFQVGAVAGGYGYYKLSGGTLTANEIGIGGLFNATTGVMDITGGNANTPGWVVIGRGGTTSSGVLNVIGGTMNLVFCFSKG